MTTKKINIKKLINWVGIAILLNTQFAYAQESKMDIKGMVTESVSGDSLQSALISVSGTQISVTTSKKGTFEIKNVDPEASLVVQLPGYDTREIYLHGKSEINIHLVKYDLKSMDDLVVLPNGDETFKSSASALGYLSSNDLDYTSDVSVDNLMQGKLAGVNVTRSSGMPGSFGSMYIRGVSSLYGKNQPLIILDDVIHEIQYPVEGAIDGFVFNPFDIVDIDDIQNITVIKDAQSEYGALASNGIVLINTEQKKETSTAFKIHVYQGVVTSPKSLDVMDATQYKNNINNLKDQLGLSTDEINERFPWINGAGYQYSHNTDWQDEIFKNGLISKYNLFLKGGDKIATYNISTGYLDHKGFIENTRYSKFNLRVNGKINITNKFSVSPNVKIAFSDSYLMEQGYNQVTNPLMVANLKAPIFGPYTIPNTESLKYLEDEDVTGIGNPMAIVNNLDAINRNYSFIASGKARYEFTENLSLRTMVAINFNNASDKIFIPNYGLSPIDSANNTMRAMVTEFRSSQNNNVLTYTKNLENGSNLNVQLGNRFISSKYEYDKGTDLNSVSDDYRSVGSGASNQQLRTTTGGVRYLNMVSFYSMAKYSMMDKYYVTAALSYDGNSLLNENTRFNLYPSVGLGYRLLSGTSALDEMKLRASYGITGNVFNNYYDYSKLYYVSRRLESESTLVMESLFNEKMKVEKKHKINVGLDLASGGQKTNFSIDLFHEMTNNMLMLQNIPAAYGFNTFYDNGGGMTTSGVEIDVNYRFNTGLSEWMVGGNITSQINKVTELDFLYDDTENDYLITGIYGAELITEVGSPLFAFYGFETNGTYANDAEASAILGPIEDTPYQAGDTKFIDQNGDNKIDDQDKVVIGNPNPLFFGSLFAQYSLNKLKVFADFYYSYGNDIYNHFSMRTHGYDNFYNQHPDVVTNSWTPSNTSAESHKFVLDDPRGNNLFSDKWMEDGSYIKLKRITVSYTFENYNKFYKNLEIYVTASNLLTLTKYSGYDPEFMYSNDMYYRGVDYGKMPFSRTFIVGIKLGL